MLLEDIISFQNVGLIGVSFYVLSYAGLQLGLLSGSGSSYTLMNLAAASLVLISLMETYNQSATLIQIIWIFMSLFGLLRRAILQYLPRLSSESMRRGFCSDCGLVQRIPGCLRSCRAC